MRPIPLDFRIWQAAQSCGVPPWEMADAPLDWLEKALTYESARSIADREKMPKPPKTG